MSQLAMFVACFAWAATSILLKEAFFTVTGIPETPELYLVVWMAALLVGWLPALLIGGEVRDWDHGRGRYAG